MSHLSIDEAATTSSAVETVEILIIGFGFSCIPLLRELDLSGVPYAIVSERDPIWKRLENSGRLDFDLVSSYHSSFYSFDLVHDSHSSSDRYTTATEFYQMHLRYLKQYEPKILFDRVDLIKNYSEHSDVYTEGGKIYRAKNVVISTGFRRKIHQELTSFDYNIENKTVLFTSMGDSANLMISKLVPRGNQVVIATDRFLAVDKFLKLSDCYFAIDQLEAQNFSYMNRWFYFRFISSILNIHLQRIALVLMGTPVHRYLLWLISKFCRLIFGGQFFSKYPQLFRFDASEHLMPIRSRMRSVPFPNGQIAIKQWPIETYAEQFGSGESLENAIKAGYVLNDIHYFIDEGLVSVVPKSKAKIDRESKTISYGHEDIKYDFLIEGDRETPRIPTIMIEHSENSEQYHYRFKDTYLGVIPRNLRNIYLIGFTRPFTGGLAIITEMQSLFVHQLLTEKQFKQDVMKTLDEKLCKYNTKHYHYKEEKAADHLVYAGTYTEDVARVMGINMRLRDCRSIDDVKKLLYYPNLPHKYRQRGKYQVQDCDKLVDGIYKRHDKYWFFSSFMIRYVLYRVMLAVALISFAREYGVVSLGFLGAVVSVPIWLGISNQLSDKYHSSKLVGHWKTAYLTLGVVSVLVFGWVAYFFALGGEVLLTLLMRIFKPAWARYLFGDLKVKSRFHRYFQEYVATFNRVKADMSND